MVIVGPVWAGLHAGQNYVTEIRFVTGHEFQVKSLTNSFTQSFTYQKQKNRNPFFTNELRLT